MDLSGSDQKLFVPKRSKAKFVWLSVIAIILLALFIRTSGNQIVGHNFLLSGRADLVGAEVFVDGAKKGLLSRSDNAPERAAVVWLKLPDGLHTVEVTKPGFKSFREKIELKGEGYLGVDMRLELEDRKL